MTKNEQVIKDLDRVIGLIETDTKDIPTEEKKAMVAETLDHFDNFVSPGWLKYRKSVSSDSEGGAVLEWQDEGAYCYGLNGEKFIDCLGGFGIYTCGHRNKEILDVVKAQLDHQALHSQELLDPLRGYLAKAMADITPGELQYCFFTNGGAEAVEMALKLARIATGGRWYISTVGAFHGKSMGAISMGGKNTYRVPYTPMVQQVQHVEYGNAEDMRKAIKNLIAVGEKVAAVILEPIQGEAGVIIPPKGYLKEVREISTIYVTTAATTNETTAEMIPFIKFIWLPPTYPNKQRKLATGTIAYAVNPVIAPYSPPANPPAIIPINGFL